MKKTIFVIVLLVIFFLSMRSRKTSSPAVVLSDEKIVYLVNTSTFTLRARVVGGKSKEVLVEPKQVQPFVYDGFERIVLRAEVLDTSKLFLYPIRETEYQNFESGAWVWYFDSLGGDHKTRDLSDLPMKRK